MKSKSEQNSYFDALLKLQNVPNSVKSELKRCFKNGSSFPLEFNSAPKNSESGNLENNIQSNINIDKMQHRRAQKQIDKIEQIEISKYSNSTSIGNKKFIGSEEKLKFIKKISGQDVAESKIAKQKLVDAKNCNIFKIWSKIEVWQNSEK